MQNSTGRMGWMAHRKWKETKQLPGTAGPGNMLGCCLISLHFLWAIHPIRPVLLKYARFKVNPPYKQGDHGGLRPRPYFVDFPLGVLPFCPFARQHAWQLLVLFPFLVGHPMSAGCRGNSMSEGMLLQNTFLDFTMFKIPWHVTEDF